MVRQHTILPEPEHMSASDSCYRLTVAGPLSQTVAQLIEARFGAATSVTSSGTDSSVDLAADQAALRALLTLLWDFGHDLLAIGQFPGESMEPEPCLSRCPERRADHNTKECTA